MNSNFRALLKKGMQPSGQGTDKPTAQAKLQRSIREAKQTIENDNPSGMSTSFKVLTDYKTIRMLPVSMSI